MTKMAQRRGVSRTLQQRERLKGYRQGGDRIGELHEGALLP